MRFKRECCLPVCSLAGVRGGSNPLGSTTIFNGGLLGATSIVGGRGTTDGKLKFPIYSKNTEVEIKIINDTPLATAILGLEYESSFNPRARRIG